MITGWTKEESCEYITAIWDLYTAMPLVNDEKRGKGEKQDATRTDQGKVARIVSDSSTP